MKPWYFEYHILHNRPGLLGDVATLLGMMNINILTVNGLTGDRRGFLLHIDDLNQIFALQRALEGVPHVETIILREATFQDMIALRHGRAIAGTRQDPPTYYFTREEVGILVDFLGESVKSDNTVIGLRGLPRIGKTEVGIAACVYANRRWVLLSSTLLRQIMREELRSEEKDDKCVYIIDGITTTSRGTTEHRQLIREVLTWPQPKIIEHPDIFMRDFPAGRDIFTAFLELRQNPEEMISMEGGMGNINSFDIS